MTNRRRFLRDAALGSLAVPLLVRAQNATGIRRVGILRPTRAPGAKDALAAESLLPAHLARLGYVEGRNLEIATRYADGDAGRLPSLARDLVQAQPDVIVAVGAAGVRAAKAATTTIPIVMWGNFDPVALGFVASLARPGGNLTGVMIAPEGTLAAKKLQILREAVPGARRVAVLAPQDPSSLRAQLPELKPAAAALGMDLAVVEVRNNDYADAFARIIAGRPDALFVIASTYFVGDRRPVIALAARHRLPAIWEWREQVIDGGLMAYGSSLTERNQRIAEYIDRILRGADPGGLPVDQPTTFKLTVNRSVAKAMGLALPQSLLLRADELIE